MKNATVKNITLNKSTREIIITISAKGSIFVQEPSFKRNGFPYLVGGASIIEGIDLLLEHHYLAVKAIKDMVKRVPYEKSEQKQELIDALTVMLSIADEPKNKYNKAAHEKADRVLKDAQRETFSEEY